MREPDTIHIMLRPDGTVHFGALTPELLELAAALNPLDPEIARRLAVLRAQHDAAKEETHLHDR